MTFLMQEPIKILSPKVLNSIAKECVQFGVKNLFVSSVTVNARRSSTQLTHKKERLWKDGLYLNRPGKDLLMKNFLRSLNNFLKKIKRTRSCDIGLSATKLDIISCGSST